MAFDYKTFIDELRVLVAQGHNFAPAEKNALEQPFKRWRLEVVAHLDEILKLGYRPSCRIALRHFRQLPSDWGPDRPDMNLKVFERDMSDTLDELEVLINYFDKHGAPLAPHAPKGVAIATPPITPPATESAPPLKPPETVTLHWVWKHTHWSWPVVAGGTLVTAFAAGYGLRDWVQQVRDGRVTPAPDALSAPLPAQATQAALSPALPTAASAPASAPVRKPAQ
jgi:hypothetical protein